MWRLTYYANEDDAFALDHNKKRALRPYSVKCKDQKELKALAKILEKAGIKCVSQIEGMLAILVNTRFKTWATYPKPVMMTCKDNRTFTAQDFLEEVLNPVFFPDDEQRLPNHDPNRYYSNYEADAVIREDENGKRYIRWIEHLEEVPASEDDKEAWGIPSFGRFNMLRRITKEDYDGYGVTWDWNPKSKGPEDIRRFDTQDKSKKPKPTKEEIEQYRQAVIEELKHLDVELWVNIEQEIQVVLGRSDDAIIECIKYNTTPLECAEMLVM